MKRYTATDWHPVHPEDGRVYLCTAEGCESTYAFSLTPHQPADDATDYGHATCIDHADAALICDYLDGRNPK